MSKKTIELWVLRGLPASGKSTYARQWVNENPKKRVIVNRDNIRRMLGPYWVPQREKLVTRIENEMIIASLEKYYSVMVDATNLRSLDRFRAMINQYSDWMDSHIAKEVELKVKDFRDVPLETCLERDKEREESVGEDVIMRMYNKYLKED